MKILMIFIDMLRPGLLHMYDNTRVEWKIESIFYKWGGTVYTNCFTPSPDTPRSNGCIWSGQYPKKNGCDTRLKYPEFFLREKDQNLLSMLRDTGYKFNFYMHPTTQAIGELPASVKDVGNYSKDRSLREYLSQLSIAENSLTLFCIEDMHQVITDCYADSKFLPLCDEKTNSALKIIDDGLDVSQFDLMVVYSDHGFRMYREPMPDFSVQLGRMRTQVFMLVREKGQKGLSFNSNFCSLLDIYPTICEAAKLSSRGELDGESLFDNKNHFPIFIEDHRTFGVQLGQTIEYWGVLDESGAHFTDSTNNWIGNPLSDSQKQYYENIMKEKCSNYDENVRMTDIRKKYADCLVSIPFYSDGTRRKEHMSYEMRLKHFLKETARTLFHL